VISPGEIFGNTRLILSGEIYRAGKKNGGVSRHFLIDV